jgi:hypothetical protein
MTPKRPNPMTQQHRPRANWPRAAQTPTGSRRKPRACQNKKAPHGLLGGGRKRRRRLSAIKTKRPRTVCWAGVESAAGDFRPIKTKRPRTVYWAGPFGFRCFSTCDQRAKSSRAPPGFLRVIVRFFDMENIRLTLPYGARQVKPSCSALGPAVVMSVTGGPAHQRA